MECGFRLEFDGLGLVPGPGWGDEPVFVYYPKIAFPSLASCPICVDYQPPAGFGLHGFGRYLVRFSQENAGPIKAQRR